MSFFSGLWDFASGAVGSLAKVALLGYVSKLLNKSTDPTSSGNNEIVDKGVRLQLNPSTENQIPVLYGTAYFGGYITDAQISTDYKKMTYCLTLAELTGNKLSSGVGTSYIFEGVYLGGNRVVFKADGVTVDYTIDSSGNQDISARGLIKIYFYCDQTGVQPWGYSGTTPSPFDTMPGWSALTHSMEDLCYAIVEVTYNRDAGISGLPECTFHLAGDMKLVGDVLYDYMTNTRYGAGIDPSEIDADSLDALNTYCTTGFSYTDLDNLTASSQITINGLVDTGTDVLTNMMALAEAGSSWMSYDIHTGAWKVIINKTETSQASFTDSNIVGEISISGTSLIQLNNVANVKYQNTDILDKTDFVKISIPEVDLFANEPMNAIQINLPFTNKQVVAAKIGLQQLKQARVDKVIQFKTDYSYILLGAGDVIDVTSSVYGFTNKLFRIVTVTQSQGDAGEILLDFTALEYDSAVYDYDITEYLVETDNGILGIGSIGKPNTPTVIKTEEANIPSADIYAVVPTGIVESLEYWVTYDTGTMNDSARTYNKVGTVSDPTGAMLNEDDPWILTFTQCQADFYVKVRGINGIKTGPFSDPSGLITFKPTVVADTVSDTPVSIGGQLMGLGLLTLLNNLDKLFGGDNSPGGLFDKIFEVFKDKTGVDLVGQAEGGTLVVRESTDIDALSDVDTTTSKPYINDKLKWDGVNWVPESADSACHPLYPKNKYPSDRSDWADPVPQVANSDFAPTTGSYFLRMAPVTAGTPDKKSTDTGYTAPSYGPVYKALTKGTGNIKLYKSNGTLVQTLTASSIIIDKDVIEIPFSTRDKGTDYYVLMDAGIVTYDGCASAALSKPTDWNFNTPWPDQTPYTHEAGHGDKSVIGALAGGEGDCAGSPAMVSWWVKTTPFDNDLNKTNRHTDIVIVFDRPIMLGTSGTVTISGHQTFNVTQTFESNKVSELLRAGPDPMVPVPIPPLKPVLCALWINPTVDLTTGSTYTVTVTANAVTNECGTHGNAAITGTTIQFTVDPGPTATVALNSTNGSVNQGGVGMTFDRTVTPGAGKVKVYQGSTLVGEAAGTNPAVTYTEV